MGDPTPFEVDIPQSKIDEIMARVQSVRWPATPKNAGWNYGTDLDYMKEVVAYWQTEFDWTQAQTLLNKFPQFKANVDGIDIHFVHVRGSGDNPTPLLLTHGWPGSHFEFWDAIEPLTHPEKFGGREEDACDVIVPSLIGYGFSGPPETPISPRTIARYWDKLMRDVLGYDSYIAQGGDWGSVVTGWLGYDHDACKAIHLNMPSWTSPGVAPETEEEVAHAAKANAAFQADGSYLLQQATKPQTLSFAMTDSPVGTAAWVLEKFMHWSDVQGGNLDSVYTKDQLLTNIMIYLVTDSFASSVWVYNGYFADPGGDPVPAGARIEKPVGVAKLPGEPTYMWPPRTQVERSMNVVHWTDFKKGGHFAALEQPELFVKDVQTFLRTVKAQNTL